MENLQTKTRLAYQNLLVNLPFKKTYSIKLAPILKNRNKGLRIDFETLDNYIYQSSEKIEWR